LLKMADKKIFGVFTTNKLLIFHYFLLVLVLFIAHNYSTYFENMVNINWYSNIPLFLYYVLWFYVGDQIIHAIIKID